MDNDQLDEIKGKINNIGKDVIKILSIIVNSKVKEKREIIGLINKILIEIDEIIYKIDKENEVFEIKLIDFDEK